MTVAELVKKLRNVPPDTEVKVELINLGVDNALIHNPEIHMATLDACEVSPITPDVYYVTLVAETKYKSLG